MLPRESLLCCLFIDGCSVELILTECEGNTSTGKLRKESKKLPQKMGEGCLRRINLDE